MTHIPYAEIDRLRSIRDEFAIKVDINRSIFLGGDESYVSIGLNIGKSKYKLFVYDEYEDLSTENQLLSLCLTLRELEQYDEAPDFLVWCSFNSLDPANQEVREYHMNLRSICISVIERLGEIDSCISGLDFELNAGSAQWLRINGISLK